MNKRFYVTNEIEEGTAEMFFFGTIGDDLTSAAFAQELKDLAETNDTIVVRINSGGGSIFDGLAIYGALKNCPARIIGKIDGLCASMATICAIAMDKVYMSSKAMFMTHKASGWANGSAEDLKTYASMMDNLENVLVDVYAQKTGLSATDAKAKFLKPEDTWFTAQQALDAKLIDGIYDDGDKMVSVPAMKDQRELIAFYNSFLSTNIPSMKQFLMTAGQLAALNLTATSDATAVTRALDGLIAKANKVDQLQVQVNEAVQARTTAETELANLKKTTTESRVDALLSKALDTDKKITAEMKTALRAQYLGNPDGLESLLKAMPAIVSVTGQLRDGQETGKKFEGKTWMQMDKEGLLDEYKAKHPAAFKAMYKERFGVDYKG